MKLASQIGISKPGYSIKVNKDLIKARQVQACPELGTAQPQLVLANISPCILKKKITSYF